ncbi:hypothetical protein [uncultured Sphingomonas sp.]|uniref:hypothetical protein n=1 Tax=uncultured Sphingomonas sp. TaxID=158754 RepID=UPI0025D56744|nr:hypothetical protein [uncultured Sphingomonas sp.]
MKDWQIYALAVFAVFAGQILRMGQKIEAGRPVTWRDLFVTCSLLPAFGAMAGAAAVHLHWPAWTIIVAGVSAGWMGFATMRFVLVLGRNVAAQLTSAKVD